MLFQRMIKNSFLMKIFLGFSMLIMIIGVAFYLFCAISTRNFVLNKSKQLVSGNMMNICQTTKETISQVKDGVGTLVFSKVLTSALKDDPQDRDGARKLEVSREANEAIRLAFSGYLSNGLNVSVVGYNGDFFSNYYLQKTEVGEAIKEKYGKYVRKNVYTWLTNENIVDVIQIQRIGNYSTQNGYQLTLIAPVQVNVSSQPLGFVIAQFDWEYFRTIFRDQLWSKESMLLIKDKLNNNVLFSMGNNLDTKTFVSADFGDEEGQMTIQGEKNEEYLLHYATFASPEIQLMEVVPVSTLMNDWGGLRTSFILCIIIGLIIMAISVIGLYGKYSRPIKSLNEAIQQVDRGDYNVSIKQTSNDDIGMICRNFEKMSHHIASLNKSLDEKRNEKIRLEVEALQIQMRPHFLLNALNTIRWMAVVSQADNVADMVVALSNFLRMAIQTKQTMITIEQELEIVQNYTLIQRRRFGSAFKLEYDVAPEILQLTIPRFTIQPIVENAILHGIDQNNTESRILLRGVQEGSDVCIVISDNGQGMTENQLNEIRRKIHDTGISETSGIGLINVHQRLKMAYGENYGITIDSKDKAGTTVTIRLPSVGGEGNKEYVQNTPG